MSLKRSGTGYLTSTLAPSYYQTSLGAAGSWKLFKSAGGVAGLGQC